jgi:hypothetical protein
MQSACVVDGFAARGCSSDVRHHGTGFVRPSLQLPLFATDIAGAKQALAQLRAAKPGHVFLPDALGADALPAWVKTAKHTTDGHLTALAARHHAKLATLDIGIPGAVFV